MKKNKRKFVVGEKVYITENARCLLGVPDGIEFEIFDILKLKVNSPYVLVSEELGDGYFFLDRNELIKIKK